MLNTKERPLNRFAWLSIGAALVTMAIKFGSYLITGSVGLLSDAMESIVNLFSGVMALAMLTIAQRPPDEEHAYGHNKAEYFSSGMEGALILVAAISIGITAVRRLIHPLPLQQLGVGLVVNLAASGINLGVSLVMIRAGEERESITLEANGRHLMTDVWTSVGVAAGVGAVALTGWERLDPLIALAVAGNIVWTGFNIVRRSVMGLMDTTLPEAEQKKVRDILDGYVEENVKYHALRTRRAGSRRFISFHVIVPGEWSIQRGHFLLESMEGDIRGALLNVTVITHIEPLGDPTSWRDKALDRPGPTAVEDEGGGGGLDRER
jgi:cation diffusion facilitator family transporter